MSSGSSGTPPSNCSEKPMMPNTGAFGGSDSTRTRQTYKRMKDAFDEKPEVIFTHDFYHGTLGAIHAALAQVDDDVSTVMVIGHNPGWEDAVAELCGAYLTMTTCNAALLSVEADSWRKAAEIEGGWRLVELLRPKEL